MLRRTIEASLLKLRSKWKGVSWLRKIKIWKWKLLSHVHFFATPWTIHSMEFSRPEYWDETFPFQGIFPTQGLNPGPPHYSRFFTSWDTRGKKKIWSQSWAWRKALSQDALPEQYRRVKNNPHQIALKVPMELKAFSLTDPFLSIHTAKKQPILIPAGDWQLTEILNPRN